MIFFTINLYNFILFIPNNFLKNKFKNTNWWIYRRNTSVGISHRGKCHTHRWVYRRIQSVGISQRVVENAHSLTTLQTDRVRWHFTESGGNAHAPTNLQTERVRRYFIESWKIFIEYTIINDGIKYVGIFPAVICFFLRIFSVCKIIGNIFFYR